MTIESLKEAILTNNIKDDFIILKTNGSDFLATHYVDNIIRVLNKPPLYIESIDEILYDTFSFFSEEEDDTNVRVLVVDKFDTPIEKLAGIKSLIVVTNKFADKELESQLSSRVVTMPKLEDWQITDYVYSLLEGVDKSDLDWLLSILHNNLYRLDQEISKLSLFTVNERKYLFKEMRNDGTFNDLSTYNIFNFSNAITHKDVATIKNVYKELSRIDVSDFGLLSILLKGFRNILMVQLNPNPTPENTGIESKQLYAIRKIPRVYSPDQIVEIFSFLSDIDRQVKSGELPTEILIDYMLVKILSIGGLGK
jgi:DNA polymerase III delta subunit